MPRRLIFEERKRRSHSISCEDSIWEEFGRVVAEKEMKGASEKIREFIMTYLNKMKKVMT